ncbi:methyltransferase domain-containing protein [Sulfurimonas sp.]|jgi:ubiquinone/menaquinone biosynthesis C-methylase UbiE|uniref:class I SAM-dependent methyltransferase n=1 Tax=Sulfurimonas sp. TaxID=2022749 RepID=UPI0025F1B8F4|nr:methyltransferase domain-containing protein [Sulfurimonas sp.]MCK9472191.1 methyltransferase domain-containing protein [Sulfurimonas sp.]MDD3504967.1 methyltransferase domain-containing protein [Sulfurimonas sp.]
MYISPANKSKLSKKTNYYQDSDGNKFLIQDGLPNFIYPKELPKSDLESIEWYKNNAADYDEFLPLTFETFGVDEDIERGKMINALKLEKDHKVLEIGCGTGRDSEKIAKELGENGELYLQDISKEILKIGVEKFSKKIFQPKIEFSLANGYYLPFEDNYFDRVFHFGGLNTFGDIKRAFEEMVRVCKPGGRIIVGDENMPIWLRETEFGKVLMNSNPHYKYNLPLEHLPVEARNVKLEWFIGGVFYFISFDVGIGEPKANIDFEIPGVRGGTHRTRYYGHIEGVDQETVELAKKARQKNGKSMHRWLNEAIKNAAIKELEE